MSLINKMLKDLEARDRATSSGVPMGVVLNDLRPVRGTNDASPFRRPLMIFLPLAIAAGIGIYYYRTMPGKQTEPLAATMAKTEVTVAASAVTLQQVQAVDEPPVETVKSEPTAMAPERTVPAAKPKTIVTPPTIAAKSKAALPATKRASKPIPSTQVAIVAPTETVTIEKSERPVTPYEQADERYRTAAQYMNQGRVDDARAKLSEALVIHPTHHAARELSVAVAMQNGRLHEAQQLLTQGLKLSPGRLSFAQLLARVHLQQGDEAQAVATLERARDAGAANADYLSFLAALYQRAGRHTDAVVAYRGAIEVRTQDARAWLGLGISLEATDDGNGAASAYNRALALGGLDAKLAQYAQQRLAAVKK